MDKPTRADRKKILIAGGDFNGRVGNDEICGEKCIDKFSEQVFIQLKWTANYRLWCSEWFICSEHFLRILGHS